MSGTKVRVTVWNEFVHERELPEIAAVYPDGIHGAIREFLETNEDIEVKTATLDEPNQGLSRDLLANTDVLIWWSHAKQEEVTDENVRLVQSEVQKGMGLIALHSAHYSKIMRQILGTPMTLKWREHDTEKLWCIDPSHPIAQGVPECIVPRLVWRGRSIPERCHFPPRIWENFLFSARSRGTADLQAPGHPEDHYKCGPLGCTGLQGEGISGQYPCRALMPGRRSDFAGRFDFLQRNIREIP